MMAKPWNEYRPVIIKLYIQEGRTLENVRRIMKAEYGFTASIRSYRQHFDQWNVGKYNCKKRQQRRQDLHARNLLPSPPRTPPTAGFITGLDLTLADHEVLGVRGITSPDSVLSALHSNPVGSRPPPEHRPVFEPVPSHIRPMAVAPSRYPPYFENHGPDFDVRRRTPPRTKCLPPMGAPSDIWAEDSLQGTLPMPCHLSLEAPSMDPSKLPGKYLQSLHQSVNHYPDLMGWTVPRNDVLALHPFQLSPTESDYIRLPYQETVPRHMPEPFHMANSYARPIEYRSGIQSPATSPGAISPGSMSIASQPMDRHTSGPGMEAHLANSHHSFDGVHAG